MKKNDNNKNIHDYCFVRFMNFDSVQKALSHSKALFVNGVELWVSIILFVFNYSTNLSLGT